MPNLSHADSVLPGTLSQRIRNHLILRFGILQNHHVRRVGKGVVWALSGQVIGRGSALLAGLLAARMLGVDGFGQLGMIRSSIGVFAVFAGMGLGITATRYVAANRETDPALAGQVIGLCNIVALVLSLLMALVLFIYAPYLASGRLNNPALASSLRIGAVMLLATSLLGAATGTLAGFEDFRSIAMAGVVEGGTVLVFTIPLAYFYGVNGAVAALVVSRFASLLAVQIRVASCCRKFKIRTVYRGMARHLGILWKYSFPAFLCGFLYGPAIWVLNLIVVNQPDGYKMLGLMSAADQWRTLILFVPGALGGVILPMLANLSSQEGTQYQRAVTMNIVVQCSIALCVALPIAALSSFIASFYGSSFVGLPLIIAISCAIVIFHTMGGAAGNALMSIGAAWQSVMFNFGWALLLIASGYILVPRLGAVGLALAYLVAQSIHGITLVVFVLYFKRRETPDVIH